MSDRLAEIKALYPQEAAPRMTAYTEVTSMPAKTVGNIWWLIGEVERLHEILRWLEVSVWFDQFPPAMQDTIRKAAVPSQPSREGSA